MAKDSFQEYSSEFQSKLLALFLKDKSYFSRMLASLTEELFDSDADQWIIQIMKSHYEAYKEMPTINVFKLKYDEIDNSVLKPAVVERLKEVYTELENALDLEFVKDEFRNFCINQSLKKAVWMTLDDMKEKKFENIKPRITAALNAYQDIKMGYEYENDVEERLTKASRINLIPTEWVILNEILDGGAGAGDLFTLIGSAGSGKSWALISVACYALIQGFNVAHFTLELNDKYTAKRYDSKISGIKAESLKYFVDDVKAKIDEMIKGKLRIFYHPTKTATVTTLRSEIDWMIATGNAPNLIIVDYADLLKSEDAHAKKAGSYFESGGIYEELRQMAGEYNVPVWTASQAQRGAADSDIITGDQVAESYKKIMTADFVVSLSRKIEDKLANTARWHVVKNRYGPDGLTFPSKMDATIGKIQIFAPDTENGKKTKKEMSNSKEVFRKNMSEKYSEFKKHEGFEE